MSNYRRTSKPKTEHIKKGFTVFQKTVATIGSILGLITASITIMNALDNNKNTKKEPTTTQTTTIVKEIQKAKCDLSVDVVDLPSATQSGSNSVCYDIIIYYNDRSILGCCQDKNDYD